MKNKYQAIVGEYMTDDAVNLVREHLMSETTNGSSTSLRSSIRDARKQLNVRISTPSIVNVINQHYAMTEFTQPVIQKLIDMALEKQTEAA